MSLVIRARFVPMLASLLALMLTALPTRAGAETLELLAVLDFDAPDKSLNPDELQVLTDAFRSAVVKAVGNHYKVLTRETMAELVPPERLQCFVDKCAAEIGRMLQAPYVAAGTLRKLGTRQFLTIEAYESRTGRLLGSEQIRGASLDDLLDAIDARAQGLSRTWFPAGQVAPVVAVKPAPPVEVVVAPAPAPTPAPVVAVTTPPAVAPAPPATANEPAPVPTPPVALRSVAIASPALANGGPQPAPKESVLFVEPVAAPYRRSVALRAGLGGHTGVVGFGLEYRPSWWGLAIGTGWKALSLGFTAGPADNRGGPYVDAHLVALESGPLNDSGVSNGGFGLGVTAGWDFRFWEWLSVKAGAGVAFNSRVDYSNWSADGQQQGPWMIDLNVGPVF